MPDARFGSSTEGEAQRPSYPRVQPLWLSANPALWTPEHAARMRGQEMGASPQSIEEEAAGAYEDLARLAAGRRAEMHDPFVIGQMIYSQSLKAEEPGYRWIDIMDDPPLDAMNKSASLQDSLVILFEWLLDYWNFLARQHIGTSTLCANAGIHVRGLLLRSLDLAKSPSSSKAGLGYIRSTARHAFSASSLMRLEIDCRNVAEKIPESAEHYLERRGLVAQMCLLAAASIRAALVLDEEIAERIGNTTGLLQSAMNIAAAMHQFNGLDLKLLRDIPLHDLATAMWSISHPYRQQVFISHRGPEYRDKAIQGLRAAGIFNWGIRPGEETFSLSMARPRWACDPNSPPVYFLDALIVPETETCRGFLWREMWESTHLHSILTEGYADSLWCLTELRLWRLMSALQSWRKTTVTNVSGAQGKIKDELASADAVAFDRVIDVKHSAGVLPKLDGENPDALSFGEVPRGQLIGLATTFVRSRWVERNIALSRGWQQIANATHRLLSEFARVDGDGFLSARQPVTDLLSQTLRHPPGSPEIIADIERLAPVLGQHSVIAWLLYFVHRAITTPTVSPTALESLLDMAMACGPALVGTELLQSRADVDLLSALSFGDQVSQDPWVVRPETPGERTRVVLCGLVLGLAGHHARLEQLRSEMVTGRVEGGVRLGILPAVTGQDWEEIRRLVWVRAIDARLSGLAALKSGGRFDTLLEEARALRQHLIGKSIPPEPVRLGAVRVLLFSALWRTRQFAEAYDFVKTTEPVSYILDSSDEAYQTSICTELAVRLDRPADELLDFGERSFKARMAMGELHWALLVCHNVCNMLWMRDEENLNEVFARRMIELGPQAEMDQALPSGFSHLIDNAQRAQDATFLAGIRDQLASVELPDDDGRAAMRRGDLLSRAQTLLPPGSNRHELENFKLSEPQE